MSDPAAFRVAGRWVTMMTATRCVHHVALADTCGECAIGGGLADVTDDAVQAEAERRFGGETFKQSVEIFRAKIAEIEAERDAARQVLAAAQERIAQFESGGRASGPAAEPDKDSQPAVPRQRTGSKKA